MTATTRTDLTPLLVKILTAGSARDPSEIVVLDVGCGGGRSVSSLLEYGYDAYGCDLKFKQWDSCKQQKLVSEARLRLMQTSGEKKTLPFPDGVADVIFTDQVIEHVVDLDLFFHELARVARPDAISFHYFPSENKVIEPHVRVPLATKLQGRRWVGLWERGPFRTMPRPDWRAKGRDAICRYLAEETHYRSGGEIVATAKKYFKHVSWEPKVLLSAMSARRGSRFLQRVPGAARSFNFLWSRFLVCRHPR